MATNVGPFATEVCKNFCRVHLSMVGQNTSGAAATTAATAILQ